MRRRSLHRPVVTLLTAAIALVVGSAVAAGQAKPAIGGFAVGYTDIGPAIGLGSMGNASASFGGRFERAIKALPEMNNGILGIEASFDYYSFGQDFPGYSWNYRYIPIGVTANYHFKLQDTKLDPFIGLGLGYNMVSCSFSGAGASSNQCGYSSGIYAIGRVGGRYFFSPKMAAYADVGAGGGAFHFGMMFGLP